MKRKGEGAGLFKQELRDGKECALGGNLTRREKYHAGNSIEAICATQATLKKKCIPGVSSASVIMHAMIAVPRFL